MRNPASLFRRSVLPAIVLTMVIGVARAPYALQAADDPLDPTFGKGGKVRTDFLGRSRDQAFGLALQADGRIVAVGFVEGDFGLARYNADGSLDASFGTQGKVTTAFAGFAFAAAVAVQRDNKIVVAGTAFSDGTSFDAFALARYNTNGTLDTTFGVGGRVTTAFANASAEAKAVAIQADGRIVVVGQAVTDPEGTISDMAIARYTINGSLDPSFDGDGRVTADLDETDDARAVAVPLDGKIVVAGSAAHSIGFETVSDVAVLRFRSDGSPDPLFGAGGRVRTDLAGLAEDASAVMIQRDGKIVAAGTVVGDKLPTIADIGMVRYNPNGSLDPTFGAGGVVVLDPGTGIDSVASGALQRDGKIVVGSTSGHAGGLFTLTRFDTDGSLDLAFGTNGVMQGDFSTPDNDPLDQLQAIAIQPDGKIVAAGFTFNFRTDGDMNFGLLRFKASGAPTTPGPR